MDNLRIFVDIEIDNTYLISSLNKGNNTSFGIVRKDSNDQWILEIPSLDFTIYLSSYDLKKLTKFIDALNQNTNQSEPGFPNWDEAPKWATYAAMDDDGDWYWYETRPCLDSILGEWDAPNQTRFHYITNNSIFKNCGSSLLRKNSTTQGDI